MPKIGHAKKWLYILVHKNPSAPTPSQKSPSWRLPLPSVQLNTVSDAGSYLQPKRHLPCSLPFCFSSVFGTVSINAVSVRGCWVRLRHKPCTWGTRHRIKTAGGKHFSFLWPVQSHRCQETYSSALSMCHHWPPFWQFGVFLPMSAWHLCLA